MSVQSTIKVVVNCQICQRNLFKIVSKHRGVDEVSVNAEKGHLTVWGEADPILIAKHLRKTGKIAEIVSVGPYPKPPDPPKPPVICPPLPYCCNDCEVVAVFASYDGRVCNIL
ncbi:hypothetical protein UlMin_036648 [Ulmus minor]